MTDDNRFVILLRGVNVGGHHRVPKAEFMQVLKELGCSDIVIYLNSGNAICTCRRTLKSDEVQIAMERHFGFAIPTLVLPGKKVKAIAAAIPPDWSNDPPKPDKSGQKSDVLYLFDELNRPGVLEVLGHRPEIETMHYVDGAVLANVTRVNQSKGSLQKIVGTKLYSQVTVRNVNTARKLAELVDS